tara:strand:+ start:173 stop:646 length:474 start_codon:yes stop_codon:yes gene_type:complete
MIDPVSAFAVATTAYKSIKKVIGTVQEMEQISGQLGKWYSSCADIARAEQQRKNPTFLERATHGKSIEEEALQILIHKKTNLEREKEIKAMLDMRFGFGTYDEMLEMRRTIRKERAEREHARDEAKRQIANNLAITALVFIIGGVLTLGAYLVAQAR